MDVFIKLGIIAVCVTAGIFLQITLSRHGGKWMGLILPALTFSASMLYIINIIRNSQASLSRTMFGVLYTLVELNIPTLAFYIIYRNYHKTQKNHEKKKKKR